MLKGTKIEVVPSIYFEKVFVFDSYEQARNAETNIRQTLKKYISYSCVLDDSTLNENIKII